MNTTDTTTRKLIYIYRINDEAHRDCLKIGEASFVGEATTPPDDDLLRTAALKRIKEQTGTAGIETVLLHTEVAVTDAMGQPFRDTAVHNILERSGIARKDFGSGATAREWFVTDRQTAQCAIRAAREGRTALRPEEITHGQSPIVLRREQREAVEQALKCFRDEDGHRVKSAKMLWNAKMRFGKTITALQLVREWGAARRTLILTHRPVVNDGWFADFGKVFHDVNKDKEGSFAYGAKDVGTTFEELEKNAADPRYHYVYFASIQDLRGSKEAGGKFDKNNAIFATPWDLIIIDEAHEGTQTELGKAVQKLLHRNKPCELHLSGTPFNLLEDFLPDETFTWDYVMEQRAKAEWATTHPGEKNPYAGLPRMNIRTYAMPATALPPGEDDYFNFRAFFATHRVTLRAADGTECTRPLFDDAERVRHFLDLLTHCPADVPADCAYPFAAPWGGAALHHTLWTMPSVDAAEAMEAMLRTHDFFGQFRVANVAGDMERDDGRHTDDALAQVRKAIGEASPRGYSITLTCGRLTTGVTVPEWTGVLMLAGGERVSAASYLQTAFRAQSPATDGTLKTDCYLIDFAPDRVLTVINRLAQHNAGRKTAGHPADSTPSSGSTTRQYVTDFLHLCPVIAYDGSQAIPYDVDQFFKQLHDIKIQHVVGRGFDSPDLFDSSKLNGLTKEDLDFFTDLHRIVKASTGARRATSEIVINDEGLTGGDGNSDSNSDGDGNNDGNGGKASSSTPRQKKPKKDFARDRALSNLRAVSARIPLILYGADLDDDSDITCDTFTQIDDSSWKEFMPRGVTKEMFRKIWTFYDPNIFRAAAQAVRQRVREADAALTVEERIQRIAALFATFRNPDKETVLTPWRVVNRHLADTLGGYCFMNDDFTAPLDAPRFVDRGDLTADVFAADSCLLDINSKSGLYPLYLAYSVYRTRLREAPCPPATLADHQALWDQAVAKNVYVVCKTPMAKAITRRTLLGFREGKANMYAPEDLINKIKNQPELFIQNVHELTRNMKINAIVGNPPYQEEVAKRETANGQKVSMSIFHHFQILSDQIGRYTTLIYPGSRWIHRSGKGLEAFGLAQINDPHLALLEFFPDSTDVFQDVGIADGVTIVFKDMEKTKGGFRYVYSKGEQCISVDLDNPGENLLPLNPQDGTIVRKIDNRASGKYLHNAILPRSLFSIESDFVEKNPKLVREYAEGDTFDPDKEIKLFTNDRAGKSGRARWYVAKKNVIKTGLDHLHRWKVIVSSANAGGQKRSNQICVLDDHSAFGRSRVALKTFATEREARNFYRYATSELIRFAFLLSDESLTSLAKKVPDLQDYTDGNGIIDYDGDVNAQLYRLFDITDEEQAYIRSVLATKSASANKKV